MRVKQRNILIAGFIVVFFTLALALSIFVITSDESQDDRSGATTPESKPVCSGFTVESSDDSLSFSNPKTGTVSKPDSPLNMVAKGSFQDGNADEIQIYAAIAGQETKNGGSYDCSNVKSDANYNYYCAGTDVWYLVADVNDSKELEVTKSFNDLKAIVESGLSSSDYAYSGTVDEKGVVLTVNIHSSDGNICSSNIARNNGNGILYNGGSWDDTCQGGCFKTFELGEEEEEGETPSCSSMTVDNTEVTDEDEEITITVNGAAGDESPDDIQLYATAGGQTNNNPSDFPCERTDKSDSEYSYYCGGKLVWFEVDQISGEKVMTVKTTFKELKTLIDDGVSDGGNAYEGELDEKGIHIGANINTTSPRYYCSSNIARNDGKGTLSLDGSTWDAGCDNDCQTLITLADDTPVQCDDDCTTSSECSSGLICSAGKCRNSECTAESSCTCDDDTPVACNGTCEDSTDCTTGLICSSGKCRNSQCTTETDCACPPPPRTNVTCNGTCSATSECVSGYVCSGGKCRNSQCSTDTDCVCTVATVPVDGKGTGELPNTAEGDEVYLIVFGSLLMIGTAVLVARPNLLGRAEPKYKRPDRFRRDF